MIEEIRISSLGVIEESVQQHRLKDEAKWAETFEALRASTMEHGLPSSVAGTLQQ